MSKPYDFTSPLITENGLKKVAEIIKANFATIDKVDQAVAGVDLSGYVQKDGDKTLISPTDVTQIATNKTNIEDLQTRVGSIESDLDGLLTVLEEVV